MWERYSPLTLPVKFEHRIGSLVPDVQQQVTEKKIDLVIMGTHGAQGTTWGSNTEKVIRNVSVPVLAIRKAPEKTITNIVFPVAPAQTGERLVDEVKKLQAFFNARLQLLWINTPIVFKTDAEAQFDLQTFANTYSLKDYTVNIRSDYTIEEGIFRFAKETAGQMIAMGTHHWKGLAHFFVGSHAGEIARVAAIPLWTCTLR
jgi:nucleotide-binding universal stress UspA family protein